MLIEHFGLVCFNINHISQMGIYELILFSAYKISGIFLLQYIRQKDIFDFSEALNLPVVKANKIINLAVSQEHFGTEHQACHFKTRGQVLT